MNNLYELDEEDISDAMDIAELITENDQLQQRIDNAIKFIQNDEIVIKLQEFENKYTVNFYDKKQELLKLLRGDK